MSELPMCACAKRHECEAKGGFRWFRPTVEWFVERELSGLARSDRNLSDLLDREHRRVLGPTQSDELRRQRKLTGGNFATMAKAAAGRPMATHRCRLWRDGNVEDIRRKKAASRTDDDERRMM